MGSRYELNLYNSKTNEWEKLGNYINKKDAVNNAIDYMRHGRLLKEPYYQYKKNF